MEGDMGTGALPLDKILHGDCVTVLNELAENSVDLIFADPPYNLQLHQELWRPNMTKVDGVDDEWDRFGSIDEYDRFTREWLTACRRVLKDSGTMWVIGSYHNIYRVGSILMDLGYWILNDLSWVKTNPMPNFRGVRFTNAHETLIWTQKVKGAKYTFNYDAMKALNDGLQMRSDWHIPICSGKERLKLNGSKVHSTQKPEALLYRVILSSSNAGDVVLDPFFGTGTTGAVAKKLGRHWIGVEQDKRYIKVALERLDSIQPELFDPATITFENRRDRPRIPFGLLLERGLLHPGQKLYFGQNGNIVATVLANGKIKWGNITGSIHEVGRAILETPCNGWEHWYYLEADTGQRMAINKFREMIRQQNGSDQPPGGAPDGG
jgi:site-specific DNA-methyltransferase (adenine-specific)